MTARYVALDLETTGLDLESDAIIEIGAVRFGPSGEVLGTYGTLVRPDRPLPRAVQALTGITEGELAGAPPLAVAAGELQDFIAGDPIVGHNLLGFDTLFLDRARVRYGNDVYDTQYLAPLLLAGLTEYSLTGLCAHLGIDHPDAHRALADAEASRALFVALRQRAMLLPGDIRKQVAAWLAPTAWPWRRFFEDVAPVYVTDEPFHLRRPEFIRPLSREGIPSVPVDAVAAIESAAGRPDLFPEYEHRDEQTQMAAIVADVMEGGRKLIVEAGTGTGKSLAYLVPAAAHSVAQRERTVVSTNTINLQEQLAKKDIPLAQALIGEAQGLNACVLKGQRNYLCLRKFEALRNIGPLSDDEALLASRILIWLTTTETGDRAELRLTPDEEALWHRVCADRSECSSSNSAYVADGTCFLLRAKRRAEAAHLVVVNHSLLLADAAMGGMVLPPYENLVVDEAHHLEDEATRQFGFSAGQRSITELLDRCVGMERLVQAGLRTLQVALGPHAELNAVTHALLAAAAAAQPRVNDLSKQVLGFLSQQGAAGEGDSRLLVTRGIRAQPDWTKIDVSWENLKLALQDLMTKLRDLQLALAGDDAGLMVNAEIIRSETSDILQQTSETVQGLAAALEQDDPQRIVWFEIERQDGMPVITWVPLAVDKMLRDWLFDPRKSVVLTGATLRGPGGFEYVQERLGLLDAETLALGSPFDYKKAALVLVPKDMPEPNFPDYQPALAAAITDLVRASQGRALVLFTSHSSLRTTYTMCEETLGREGIQVLGQGLDGSARQLVRALQAAPNTVVFGTASFWEGVDIAGDALSLLVIARLPFAVPTDPIQSARSALYDDPFSQYSLPQAVLRFKQGFGRLIRTRTDRGVLVVLDRRVGSKTYGRSFLEALPPARMHEALLRDMPGLVERWLAAPVTP